jgi:protein-disulfide isomerase
MFKEKNDFVLGISIGIAAISLLGLVMMSVAYFNKGNSENANKDDKNQVAKQDNNAPTPTPSPTPTPTPGQPVDIKVSDSDHIRGNKNAKITIASFSDFQCPYCSKFHETMKQVMAAYPNDVRWVFKDFPLEQIHPFAKKAAEAAECANEQGKFWEYADKLFENQSSFSNDYFSTLAKQMKLDSGKFDKCLADGKYASKVAGDAQLGQSVGVRGTPASFINGELVSGAVPFETVKAKIDSLK